MAKNKYICKVCGYAHEGAEAPASCPVCKASTAEFAAQKKGLFSDKNGNAYIIMYATVMVVVVAALLAVAAMSLQKRQNENMLNEKKQAILISLGAQGQNYDDYIDAYVLDPYGNKIEGADVFAQLADLKGSYEQGKFPVFEASDGRVVMPVTGTGLWGPVWGYVALDKDMNTVVGAVLDHKGETPGLGAEIATPKFQTRFIGKKIFEGDTFVSVVLRKGGATQQNIDHEVDGISGGTKTADGVTAMLRNSMTHYLPFLEAKRAAAQTAATPAETMSNEENVENNE